MTEVSCHCGFKAQGEDPEQVLELLVAHNCPKEASDPRWHHALFSFEGWMIVATIVWGAYLILKYAI